MKNTTSLPFYPPRENKFVILFFTAFTRLLLKHRFKNVFIRSSSHQTESVLVYSNHSYWWDALLPLILSKSVLKKKPRAIMEDKQMKTYSFFGSIGAFSINLEGKHLRKTLETAVTWLRGNNNALFIYPQGTMYPPETDKLIFQNGLSWILSKTNAKALPIAYYISNHKFSKPELYISVGQTLNSTENEILIDALATELDRCKHAAFDEDDSFEMF